MNNENYWENIVYKDAEDGTLYIEKMKVIKLDFEHSNKSHYLAITEDETKVVKYLGQLEEQKNRDHLTNAYNRQYINENIKRFIDDGIKFAIFHIDVDSFASINKLKGYDFGDKLIINLYERLIEICYECTITRSHGDNYILLKEFNDDVELDTFVSTLMDKLGERCILGDLIFTVSVGYVKYPMEAGSYRDVVLFAELAKNIAKHEKSNSIIEYSHQNESKYMSDVVEDLFINGFDVNHFSFVYQPIYSAKTFGIEGLEMLIRWDSEKLGSVSPSIFIPIAEKTGFISNISKHVVTSAYNLIKNNEAYFRNKYLSLNISVLDLMNDDFLDFMLDQFTNDMDISKKINIEITETYFFEQMEILNEKVSLIRSLGMKVAVDDFGTGFSSLEKLIKVNFDRIKIDQAFIQNMLDDPTSKIILRVISTLSTELNLTVTVEGVETEEQMRQLSSYGFDAFQGYYLSKPKSIESLIGI